MPFRATSPAAALAALLLATACGGGAAVPTEPTEAPDTTTSPADSTLVPPGDTIQPPPDTTAPPPNAPASATVLADDDNWFQPEVVTIRAGGTVTYVFEDNHDVVFTGLMPVEGNIPEMDEGASVVRTFMQPGTYTFRCGKHADDGMTGVVVVVASGGSGGDDGSGGGGGGGGGGGDTPPPSTAVVTTPGESFSPPTVTIAAGGSVTWNISGARHNVTFSGSAPAGGNIPDTDPGASVSRTFTAAGSYGYTCTRHDGMDGTVVVEATP